MSLMLTFVLTINDDLPLYFLLQEKLQKDLPSASNENSEDFSASSRKRRLTRIKVRKKDKTDSSQVEDPKRQKVELKGPRVKHVCRSASIVLGQPIATFPTQEEKEKQDKATSLEDDANLPDIDKDIATPELPSGDSEIDSENRPPEVVVSEITVPKESNNEIQEIKKKKTEPLVSVKSHNKSESSEDETVIELVPKKTFMKPLSNITNVRFRSSKVILGHHLKLCPIKVTYTCRHKLP